MRVVSATTGSALYLGTELDGKWWRRYRAPGYFARGNGTYAFEDGAMRFHRHLTTEATVVPVSAITGVTTGTWHAGTWLAGKPVVKVAWIGPGGEALSSGFGFADRASAEAFAAELERRRAA